MSQNGYGKKIDCLAKDMTSWRLAGDSRRPCATLGDSRRLSASLSDSRRPWATLLDARRLLAARRRLSTAFKKCERWHLNRGGLTTQHQHGQGPLQKGSKSLGYRWHLLSGGSNPRQPRGWQHSHKALYEALYGFIRPYKAL